MQRFYRRTYVYLRSLCPALSLPFYVPEVHSGQLERLKHLGYIEGEDQDDEIFLVAVEEFQGDHGLEIDGFCGDLTQQKLLEMHGC